MPKRLGVKKYCKKDISKCFICSQENDNIQNIISHYDNDIQETIVNNNVNNNANNNIITIDISNNNIPEQRLIYIHPNTLLLFKLFYITLLALLTVLCTYMYTF